MLIAYGQMPLIKAQLMYRAKKEVYLLVCALICIHTLRMRAVNALTITGHCYKIVPISKMLSYDVASILPHVLKLLNQY